MISITDVRPGVTEWEIDMVKLERLRDLLATPNTVWAALSLMDDEDAFTGLNPSAMIEVVRIAEKIKKVPTYYMWLKQQSV